MQKEKTWEFDCRKKIIIELDSYIFGKLYAHDYVINLP